MKKITILLALLLFVVLQGAFAQRTITGTVINAEDGDGLPGVTVLVKGTTTGTSTDIDGNFSLTVPNDATLQVSFIGFRTQEIVVGNQTRINVTLESDILTLGDVVVTALGITRERRTLTYSVTEVGGESIAQAAEINLGNALQGRIAGVNVSTSATGAMGSARVIIRGNTTISGSGSPLYVVDGIPTNMGGGSNIGQYGGTDSGDGLNRINPDDIESISVLKGGTAAALYGNRASNGVILITTKSGAAAASRPGLGVEYSMSYTMENPVVVPDWQYEYGSGRGGQLPDNLEKALEWGRESWGAKMNGQMVYNPDGEMRPYVAQRDNVKHFYSTGTTFQNTIAISGGNQNANFRFSASNMDNVGIVSNAKLNRKIFGLNVNANTRNKVIYTGRLQFNLTETKNPTPLNDFSNNPNASIAMMATSLDARTLKLANGDGTDDRGYEFQWTDDIWVSNPWYYLNYRSQTSLSRRMSGNFTVRYNIFDFLYASVRASTEFTAGESHNITYLGQLNDVKGGMSRGTSQSISFEYDAMIGFNKEFGNISVNALAGGNRRHSPWFNGMGITISGSEWIEPDYFAWGNLGVRALAPSPNPGAETQTNSLYGSIDLGYSNFLFLTLTGRNDWASTMTNAIQVIEAPGNNNIFYPSVGLSYIVSETWQSRPSWMSFLKARASWAQVGGGFGSAYEGVFSYSYGSYQHLGQRMMSISGTIPNWAIKPYTSTTMEAGFDMRLFNNRIGVDFTLYERFTKDERISVQFPSSTGFGSGPLNVGEINNKGVELLLTGTPITSRTGLTWDVTFNMSYNKSLIVDLAKDYGLTFSNQAVSRDGNGFVRHFVDQPYGMVAGYDYRYSKNDPTKIVYNPTTGMPERTIDVIPLGKGTPPWNISLTNSFKYKNFSMSFFLDSKWGGVLYSGTNAQATYYGKHKMTTANGVRETEKGIKVTGVTQENVKDEFGNNVLDDDGDPLMIDTPFTGEHSAELYFRNVWNRITPLFVQSSDYIKLRQIDFGYSVPRAWLASNNIPVQAFNVSFVARNLWLIHSKIDNVDPESSINSSSGYGIESFGVIPTRSFGFNLSVRF